jgi:hypothetical protein
MSHINNKTNWVVVMLQLSSFLLLLVVAPTYGQIQELGCAEYCGKGASACNRTCHEMVMREPEVPEEMPDFELELLTYLDIPTQITGSDMYAASKTGKLFFTTRDGGVFRFLPRPKVGGRVSEQVYQMSPELKLDTRANKGLYDIAFPKKFMENRLVYLLYARESDVVGIDHYLTVAEYTMIDGENITFRGIVESLPQTMRFRSGGFMKAAAHYTKSIASPLWISSGGNQEHDVDLLAKQPKYSAIYGIMPLAIKDIHAEYPPFNVWANGLSNPYECDYAPLAHPREIICLTKQYERTGELLSVSLFKAEAGHTYNEDTSTIIQTNGYRTTHKEHSFTQIFDAATTCMPESVIYSGFNLLGTGYTNRIIVAFPTCDVDGFTRSSLKILSRNSREQRWELVTMPIDFGRLNLWGMQLMGAERSRGLFLAGRNLQTGRYGIYLVKQRSD